VEANHPRISFVANHRHQHTTDTMLARKYDGYVEFLLTICCHLICYEIFQLLKQIMALHAAIDTLHYCILQSQ
jgi:hypothetical protein